MMSCDWRSGETKRLTFCTCSEFGNSRSISVVNSTERNPPLAADSEKLAELTLTNSNCFSWAKDKETIFTVLPLSHSSGDVPKCLPPCEMFTIIRGVLGEIVCTVPSYSNVGIS